MMKFTIERVSNASQGFGLPKFSQTGTLAHVNGLSTRLHRWWTKHPTVMTNTGQSDRIIHQLGQLYARVASNRIWVARIGSQRKRPHFAFLCWHCFAATRSTCVHQTQVSKSMIYTFLIAGGSRPLSKLSRLRTISVHAATELQARLALKGLPLVFQSRTPLGGKGSW